MSRPAANHTRPPMQADESTGIYPDRASFCQLAERGNIIPVYKEIIADIDTPVSALHKLGPSRFAYLLESVEGGERLGRYSFVGASASALFRTWGHKVEIQKADGTSETFEAEDPLRSLEDFLAEYRPVDVPGLPRFFGGAVGYMGYDMVRHWEPLAKAKKCDLSLPESSFLITDTLLVFDHVRRMIQIVVNARVDGDPNEAYSNAVAEIEQTLTKLRESENTLSPMEQAFNGNNTAIEYSSNVTPTEYMQAVEKAKESIRDGKLLQIVLSQRLAMPMKAEPFDMYRVLRSVNPSPYMFYLKFDDCAIVGSSPEVMVRVEEGEAMLRPLAGTRPRGKNAAEDQALARELLADEKERSEHVMLVDLGRNDLGRVCAYGSLSVEEFMQVERYSHVMHIVSTVKGHLAEGKTAFDLVRATFPAGTLTGAPKVAAMQRIDEIETTSRGPYGGAIGYFGFSGNMDCCITIRTAVIHDGIAYVQSGAGIVADSDPKTEYEETLSKARGLLTALAVAERGL